MSGTGAAGDGGAGAMPRSGTLLVLVEAGLLADLTELLASRFTRAGHLAQIVSQEHRGVCDVRGCAPSCQKANATLAALITCLERFAAEADATVPVQGDLFDDAMRPSRRAEG